MCVHKKPTLGDFVRILNGFRPGTLKDKYVIVCTKPEEEWRVALLSTNPNAPVEYLEGQVFGSVEAAQHAVSQLKAEPGME